MASREHAQRHASAPTPDAQSPRKQYARQSPLVYTSLPQVQNTNPDETEAQAAVTPDRNVQVAWYAAAVMWWFPWAPRTLPFPLQGLCQIHWLWWHDITWRVGDDDNAQEGIVERMLRTPRAPCCQQILVRESTRGPTGTPRRGGGIETARQCRLDAVRFDTIDSYAADGFVPVRWM
jgi:hypothetical protein